MRRVLCCVALPILSLLSLLLFQLVPGAADAYRARVFLPVAEKMRTFSAAFPFPLAEVLIFFLIICLLIRLAHIVRTGIRRFVKNLGYFASYAFIGYSLLWAPLYYCTPVLAANEPDPLELFALCSSLIESLNGLYAQAVSEYPELSAITDEAHALLSDLTGQLLSPAKPARYPELFSSLGIAGIYFPFTFESIINPDDIRPAVPFTACHELAHQAGWAREDEASFIAWRACSQGSPSFRYSGDFVMLTSGMRMLQLRNPRWWKECVEAMSPGVLCDFRSANGLNEAKPSGLCRFQDRLSDIFLRLNGQNDGLTGYDRAVWLAITWENVSSGPIPR